jgi:hypothetical protein
MRGTAIDAILCVEEQMGSACCALHLGLLPKLGGVLNGAAFFPFPSASHDDAEVKAKRPDATRRSYPCHAGT